LPLSKRDKLTTPRRDGSWMKYGFIEHVNKRHSDKSANSIFSFAFSLLTPDNYVLRL
jgi:hypothetical protein